MMNGERIKNQSNDYNGPIIRSRFTSRSDELELDEFRVHNPSFDLDNGNQKKRRLYRCL